MNIAIVDTETTGVEKPFVYNIGWSIYDTEANEIVYRAEYIVEQVWHNAELFTTAYYAEKRDWYIGQMKARKILMKKLGYITQRMYHSFKEFDVQGAYAYNSPFDERVFNYNCDWFKVINPFDSVPWFDIRGYVHKVLAFSPSYQQFCKEHELYTDSGNYSTTAEAVYKYITNNTEFVESHTALADVLIELDILKHCIGMGCEWNTEYKVYRSIPNKAKKTLVVKTEENQIELPYTSIREYKEKQGVKKIILKNT